MTMKNKLRWPFSKPRQNIAFSVQRPWCDSVTSSVCNYFHMWLSREPSVSSCVALAVRPAARRCPSSTSQVSSTWSSSVWSGTHTTWSWPSLLVGWSSALCMLTCGCSVSFVPFVTSQRPSMHIYCCAALPLKWNNKEQMERFNDMQ